MSNDDNKKLINNDLMAQMKRRKSNLRVEMTAMVKGRRRMLACRHEAGHILVYWYFGYSVDWAVVLTVAQIRAGVKIRNKHGAYLDSEGLMQADDVCRPPFGNIECFGPPEDCAHFHFDRARRRDVELICLMAGIKAEAIYRGISFDECMLQGGLGDVQQLNVIVSAWYSDMTDHYKVERLAERRATALLRSPHGAAAVEGLSRALFERGRIRELTIRSICKRAFQGRQVRDRDWADHWPPTLSQIRSGYLPPSDRL